MNSMLYPIMIKREPSLKICPGLTSAYFGNLNAAKVLLDSGFVNIDTKNAKGQTALMRAVIGKSKKMFSFLLENAASKNIEKSYDGKTAYDYAVEIGNEELVDLLKT